jgi:hypothetical protein
MVEGIFLAVRGYKGEELGSWSALENRMLQNGRRGGKLRAYMEGMVMAEQ